MANVYERKFVFSRTQMEEIQKIEASSGNPKPVFGTVIVKGVAKQYTDILTMSKDSKYPDARVLISGDIRNIRYTQPSFTD